MHMKLNCKEKIGIGIALGAVAVMVPVICCRPKCPEKRFAEGGREMLGAIPDIAKCYAMKVAKRMI